MPWKQGTGSLFMTQHEYERFLPGLNTLVNLKSLDAGDAYSWFLLEKGWSSTKFASQEHQALSRLLCLGSACDHKGLGDELITAFEGLSREKKTKLMDWLIADGIKRLPGYVLCDAPALLENAHNNTSVGLPEALEMMVRVQSKCQDLYLAKGQALPSKILVQMGDLATWAKEAPANSSDGSSIFSQASLDVRTEFDADDDTKVIQVKVHRPSNTTQDEEVAWPTTASTAATGVSLSVLFALFLVCAGIALAYVLGFKEEIQEAEEKVYSFLRRGGIHGEMHTSFQFFEWAALVFGILFCGCSYYSCCGGCCFSATARSVVSSPARSPLLENICHYYEPLTTQEGEAETPSSYGRNLGSGP